MESSEEMETSDFERTMEENNGNDLTTPNVSNGSVGDTESLLPTEDVVKERSVWDEILARSAVLIVLLLIQSLSSFILDLFSNVLQNHYIIVLYLPMLINTGGNAGNQSSIELIRQYATGKINGKEVWKALRRQLFITVWITIIISSAGFGRIAIFEIFKYLLGWSSNVNGARLVLEMVAITISIACVSSSAMIIGSFLPVFLHCLGLDPGISGPSIQVISDILGISLTCLVSTIILGTSKVDH